VVLSAPQAACPPFLSAWRGGRKRSLEVGRGPAGVSTWPGGSPRGPAPPWPRPSVDPAIKASCSCPFGAPQEHLLKGPPRHLPVPPQTSIAADLRYRGHSSLLLDPATRHCLVGRMPPSPKGRKQGGVLCRYEPKAARSLEATGVGLRKSSRAQFAPVLGARATG